MSTKLNILAREERVTDYILPSKILANEGQIENVQSIIAAKPRKLLIGNIKQCEIIEILGYILGKSLSGTDRIFPHELSRKVIEKMN